MMDDFEKEVKNGFLDEAEQLLSESERLFLGLEQASRRSTGAADGEDAQLVEQLFRLAHNLKGAAAMAGLEGFSSFTHQLESLLVKMKEKQIPINALTVSLLLNCNDHLHHMVKTYKNDLTAVVDHSELLAQIHAALSPTTVSLTITAPKSVVMETASAPPAVPPRKELAPETIRINLDRLDSLINRVGELVITQSALTHEKDAFISVPLHKMMRRLEKVTKEIQQTAMNLRMLPLKQVFQQVQRAVRDAATLLGKDIQFTCMGEETELDRSILNHLIDPMIHLARNAVDHGIETTEERAKTGKNPVGSIVFSARQEGSEIVLEARDDGRGLDEHALISKATEKGLLKSGQTLSTAAAYQLIFAPGFSTKAEVTELSGRGVGLDVVKSNITQLQGRIQIESEPGKGTCFRIRVPLTLAIIDGMIVRVGEDRYVLPLSNVNESLQPKSEDVTPYHQSAERLSLRGEILPLFRLSELLGKTRPRPAANKSTAIVVRSQTEKPFSILVDDIISTQSIVIKPLDSEIEQLPWIIGGAILTDGSPSLILDLPQIMEAAA